MNTVGDGSSSSYSSSSSNNISHFITKFQVVDATDNDSVDRCITLKSFEAVTSEMSKTQVYLRQIMKHLSLPENYIPKGNNSGNKAGASSKTIGNFPLGTKEHWTSWNNL